MGADQEEKGGNWGFIKSNPTPVPHIFEIILFS